VQSRVRKLKLTGEGGSCRLLSSKIHIDNLSKFSQNISPTADLCFQATLHLVSNLSKEWLQSWAELVRLSSKLLAGDSLFPTTMWGTTMSAQQRFK
jgi:hypothetical protein